MFTWWNCIALFLAIAIGYLSLQPAYAEESIPSPLRVCADPDNLPFSNEDPEHKGFYLEYAELIAKELGVQSEVFWWRTNFGKRAIRETLLKGLCDIQLGIPFEKSFMGRRVALTEPFLKLYYAILVPKGMQLRGLTDLHGKKVGVLFNTPPQNVIAKQNKIIAQTYLYEKDAIDALARGEIDAAFLWGPVVGYYNKFHLDSRFRVVSTDGPRLKWQVAIGVRGSKTGLRNRRFLHPRTQLLLNRLEGAIGQLWEDFEDLEVKYGFPNDEPIYLDWLTAPTEPDDQAMVDPDQKKKPIKLRPVKSSAANLEKGRKLYNGFFGCSHCHGPNAVVWGNKFDLRRLRKRHGENADQVFRKAVLNGRPSKGMPKWKNRINEEQLEAMTSYIFSIQGNPN